MFSVILNISGGQWERGRTFRGPVTDPGSGFRVESTGSGYRVRSTLTQGTSPWGTLVGTGSGLQGIKFGVQSVGYLADGTHAWRTLPALHRLSSCPTSSRSQQSASDQPIRPFPFPSLFTDNKSTHRPVLTGQSTNKKTSPAKPEGAKSYQFDEKLNRTTAQFLSQSGRIPATVHDLLFRVHLSASEMCSWYSSDQTFRALSPSSPPLSGLDLSV